MQISSSIGQSTLTACFAGPRFLILCAGQQWASRILWAAQSSGLLSDATQMLFAKPYSDALPQVPYCWCEVSLRLASATLYIRRPQQHRAYCAVLQWWSLQTVSSLRRVFSRLLQALSVPMMVTVQSNQLLLGPLQASVAENESIPCISSVSWVVHTAQLSAGLSSS